MKRIISILKIKFKNRYNQTIEEATNEEIKSANRAIWRRGCGLHT